MPPELTQLDHPIDVMVLIRKAIRAEARLTRQAAEQLEMGGSSSRTALKFLNLHKLQFELSRR